MKKSVITTSFLFAFASASAFAHHPAADIVDPEIYAMIDENVSDTPHADLTFDDMGQAADVAEQSVDVADDATESMADAAREAGGYADTDNVELRSESAASIDEMSSADEMIDTISMLDSVVTQLAE